MKPPSLTFDDIHRIRTEGRPDAYWELTLSVSRAAVQKARIGTTYKDHPTPPDRRPRSCGNQHTGPQAPQSVRMVSRALANWRRVECK